MKVEHIIKTFAYKCNRTLEGVDEKLKADLDAYLESVESNFSETTVIAVSHSYSGQFATFAVTLKRVYY